MHCWLDGKMMQSVGKWIAVPQNVKHELAYESIVLLSIHIREMKTMIHTKHVNECALQHYSCKPKSGQNPKSIN